MIDVSSSLFRCASKIAGVLTLSLFGAAAGAQAPQARILAAIDNQSRVTIAHSKPAQIQNAVDGGSVDPSMQLHGITLSFRRSDAQQSALDALIAAQQNPASPLYHQWLTPEQFAAQFGMASSDLTKAESWLQSQGFAIDSVSRGHDRIQFSGTAAQAASAFGAPLHTYTVAGKNHFAPSADLTIPAALADTVLGVSNLSDFRPAPQIRFGTPKPATPQFTSSQSGNHFLTPKDIATIYDVNAAYNAGYNGTGQSIAVVGQSAVVPADITRFQALAGVAVRAPSLVLVPGTGASFISTGDEAESDLDLEYSSSIAPGATVFFVYTGLNTNADAFTALSYAIDERIAPIITVSYASCETEFSATSYASFNSVLAQGAVQGQTILAAAGDEGSTSCFGETNLSTIVQETPSASFPASSQYATGLGGTEFPASAVATTNSTYWAPANGSDVLSSALSYIPEQVWNDTTTSSTEISAGGGGISVLTPRPIWQAGVPGIPAGSFRLIPDISLTSSSVNAAYLFCSSDPDTGITGSCSNGFRDSNSTNLTTAGGTSFAAPVFAGMLALINQARNSTGQGVINPILYSLASSPSTYASAFHDITVGTNACTGNSTLCSSAGAGVYASGIGYDEASGLGSVDLYKLLAAWPVTNVSVLAESTTSLTAASSAPATSAADAISITVAPIQSGAVQPTGSVTITVDSVVSGSAIALLNGSASYSFSSTAAGSHVIVASYSGDANYAPSTGSVLVSVGGTTGTFIVAAPALTVTNGSSGSTTVTVTPVSGYTGTVSWSLASSATINNACYTISNLPVPGSAAVTTQLTISTGSAQCATAVFRKGTGISAGQFGTITAASSVPARPGSGPVPVSAVFMAAGLLSFGLFGRRLRRFRGLFALIVLALAGWGLTGCGDGGSPTAPTGGTLATAGTFQIQLTGSDTTNTGIQGVTVFNLTIR